MNSLSQWKARKQKSRNSFSSLYDMLLGNKIFSYIYYRLRYFALKTGVGYLFHLITFYLLLSHLNTAVFNSFIIISIISLLATGFWWGVLEWLRSNIRYHNRIYKQKRVLTEIQLWLVFSFVLSTASIILALYFSYRALVNPIAGNLFLTIYLVCVLVNLGLEFPVRAYHSGMYALKRIYRPMWSIVGVDIAVSLLLLALFPLLHIYAIVVTYIIRSFTKAGISWYFSRKSYQFLGWEFPGLTLKLVRQYLSKLPVAILMLLGISAVFLHLDNFLIFSVARLTHRLASDQHDLLVSLYFILPLMHAGYEWTQLFYFDSKRLLNEDNKLLNERFEKILNVVSPIIGLGLGIVACVLTFVFKPESVSLSFMLVIPWLMLRSNITYLQITAFTEHRYLDVIISTCIIIAPSFLILSYSHSMGSLFGFMCVFGVFALMYLKKIKTITFKHASDKVVGTLFSLNYEIFKARQPVVVVKLVLAQHLLQAKSIFYDELLEPCLNLFDEMAWLDSHTLIAFSQDDLELVQKVKSLNAGIIKNIHHLTFTPSSDSLESYLSFLKKDQKPHQLMTKQRFITQCQAAYPNAIVCDPLDGKVLPKQLNASMVMRDIKGWLARPLSSERRKKYKVACLHNGETSVAFIIILLDRYANVKAVNAWQESVFWYNCSYIACRGLQAEDVILTERAAFACVD
jgi:hypothetical protein